jgi:hypothetical protein
MISSIQMLGSKVVLESEDVLGKKQAAMENKLPYSPPENHQDADHNGDTDPARINPWSGGPSTILANIFGELDPLFRLNCAAGPKVGIEAFQPVSLFKTHGMQIASDNSFTKDPSR